MKQLIPIVLAFLVLSCGGNKQKDKAPAAAPETPAAAAVETKAPEQTPEELMTSIVNLLPEDLLPSFDDVPELAGKDGRQMLIDAYLESSDPYFIGWCESIGECDEVGIDIKALPCDDGTYLVTYIAGAGCMCYVQGEPLAFTYSEGKLEPRKWPISTPGYDDFACGLNEHFAGEEGMAWVKEYWEISYNYSYKDPSVLIATVNCFDSPEFSYSCRPIYYHWDGKKFNRENGRHRLITESNFAGFVPGTAFDAYEAPRGYEFAGTGSVRYLVEKGGGKQVCKFFLDDEDSILEIEVVSPEVCTHYEYYPGMKLSDAMAMFSSEKVDCRLYEWRDAVLVKMTGDLFIVNREDIEADLSTPGGDWSFKPDTKIEGILLTAENIRY